MTLRACGIAIVAHLTFVVAAAELRAQSSDSLRDIRSRWGAHAGLLAYGTGDDRNCDTGAGFSAGAELRTRGAWLGAIGADLLLAAPLVCTGVGTFVVHEGEQLDVFSGTHLIGAPRLRLRGGRAFELGGPVLEAAVGVGLIYGASHFVGPNDWLVNGWYGATATLRGRRFPIGLEAEYGMHQVRIRYYRHADRWEMVHQFRRWKPFFRLSLVL